MECELCGKKTKLVKARIDGVLLNVCLECAKSGKIVEQQIKTMPVKRLTAPAQPEEYVVPDFAQQIRLARQKKGLKQEELARLLNEKLSLISSVESGKHVPDLKLARKLEKFFGIKLIEVE